MHLTCRAQLYHFIFHFHSVANDADVHLLPAEEAEPRRRTAHRRQGDFGLGQLQALNEADLVPRQEGEDCPPGAGDHRGHEA